MIVEAPHCEQPVIEVVSGSGSRPTVVAQPLRGIEVAALWIGAAVVGFTLLFAGLWAYLAIEVPQSAAFDEFNRSRVEEFAQRIDAGAVGVVLYGDSRLRYATEDDTVLADRLGETLGRDVAVLRLVNNWAVYQDFESLSGAVLEAGPSLVLIQDDLRAKDRAGDASNAIRREYLRHLIVGDDPWNPGDLDQKSLQFEMRCEVLNDESVEQRRDRVFRWVSFDEAGPNATLVREFVGELEARGVQVRYLEVPITTEARAGLPGVAPGSAAVTLTPDVEIDDSQFCDLVHMDPTGRARYTDWFVDAGASALAELDAP